MHGKTVNPRLAETGLLKAEPKTKKCNDLIENTNMRPTDTKSSLRLRDPTISYFFLLFSCNLNKLCKATNAGIVSSHCRFQG